MDPVATLQALVRLPTVSDSDPAKIDTRIFDGYIAEFAQLFPLLHERLELTRVASHGLLFHWAGRSAERPVVLMAHYDVVPAGDEAGWRHPPYAGVLDDGQLWGRGTLDDKGSMVAICTAVEQLLETGFVPAYDVWLSFGADEEVSGPSAPAAAAELRRRGVRPWLVLDEGGAVALDAFPGLPAPVAVIGVAEKGTASLLLTVDGAGGHASTPARNGPVARLARAITRLERAPYPASLPSPNQALLERVSEGAPSLLSGLMSQAIKAPALLSRALIAAGPESAAMTRTTIAVTTLSASPAINVLPAQASAGVNARVMVGDSVDAVIEHVRRTVRDRRVRIEVLEADEPSPISPYDTDGFALIERVVSELFPEAIASPYIPSGATDSRFFTGICEQVYRFTPFRMTRQQRASIHAVDEHLGTAELSTGIDWYRRFLESLAPSGAERSQP